MHVRMMVNVNGARLRRRYPRGARRWSGLAVKFWPPTWQSTEPTPAGESFSEITLPV